MNSQLKDSILKLDTQSQGSLAEALELAQAAHAGMLRDDGGEYINHPMRTCLIMSSEFGIVEREALILCILHDVLESPACAPDQIRKQSFYPNIYEELELLSLKIGSTREERDRFYINRIRQASLRVKLVKLADRLDNLRSLKTNPSAEKKQRYLVETQQNYFPLAKETLPSAWRLMEAELSSH